ncbi:hypothetical protein HDU98_003966, partial [Podochytrium sp. JEL0797]
MLTAWSSSSSPPAKPAPLDSKGPPVTTAPDFTDTATYSLDLAQIRFLDFLNGESSEEDVFGGSLASRPLDFKATFAQVHAFALEESKNEYNRTDFLLMGRRAR